MKSRKNNGIAGEEARFNNGGARTEADQPEWDAQGRKELMRAAANKRGDVVDRLHCKALMCAGQHGHDDVVQHLLNHPATDPTERDSSGRTALIQAVRDGRGETAKRLLDDSRPDVLLKDANSWAAELWAVHKKYAPFRGDCTFRDLISRS